MVAYSENRAIWYFSNRVLYESLHDRYSAPKPAFCSLFVPLGLCKLYFSFIAGFMLGSSNRGQEGRSRGQATCSFLFGCSCQHHPPGAFGLGSAPSSTSRNSFNAPITKACLARQDSLQGRQSPSSTGPSSKLVGSDDPILCYPWWWPLPVVVTLVLAQCFHFAFQSSNTYLTKSLYYIFSIKQPSRVSFLD